MGRHRIHLLYVYYLVLPLVSILAIIVSFFAVMPPREVVILAGPKEGYFATVATNISNELASFGISARIEHIEDTTHIIDRINGADMAGPHLGFVAQDLAATPTDGVFSLGMISLET